MIYLTFQVFGKLLEWEHSSSESGEGVAAEEAAGDDSDLREHVVGILFAGHKLTSLQRQVGAYYIYQYYFGEIHSYILEKSTRIASLHSRRSLNVQQFQL